MCIRTQNAMKYVFIAMFIAFHGVPRQYYSKLGEWASALPSLRQGTLALNYILSFIFSDTYVKVDCTVQLYYNE